MVARLALDGVRFDRSEKDSGFSSTESSLFTGTTSTFSMSPLLTLTPSITLAPQNNLANSYRANQSPSNISTSSTAPPKMDAVMALLSMKPQDALTPGGSNKVGAAQNAETKAGQVNGTLVQAKQQLSALDPKGAAPTGTTMMMPPPSPVITIGGGPSLFTSTSTRSKDKDRTPMYVSTATADPNANAANFTATPASAVVAARNNVNGGLRPQTTSGAPLLSAANTTSDYLRDLKLTNLDKKMGEMGQRNFAIATAARNTLIDAGLRSPTSTPVAMVLKPDTQLSKPTFTA